MERSAISAAAKATAKVRPKVVWSHRFWPIYLHLLDRIWERRRLQLRLGARIVRYADDIVIVCVRGVEKPMEVLRRVLERLGLTLNEAKTKIVNTFEGKFDFLGFSIWMGKSRRTGKRYAHVQPSKKSLKAIKDRVSAL